MHLTNFLPDINFQRRPIARCYVLRDKKPIPCTISQIENTQEDKKYLSKTLKSPDWENSYYLQYAIKDLNKSDCRLYIVENKKEKCLAFCELSDNKPSCTNIHLFESMPIRKKKKVKYLGETLITFIAHITSETNSDLIIKCAADRARNFYRKCRFEDTRNKSNQDFLFIKPRLKKLEKQNQKHTGSTIEFLT